MTATAPFSTDLRRITVAEYHRMAKAGILAEDEQSNCLLDKFFKKCPKAFPQRRLQAR